MSELLEKVQKIKEQKKYIEKLIKSKRYVGGGLILTLNVGNLSNYDVIDDIEISCISGLEEELLSLLLLSIDYRLEYYNKQLKIELEKISKELSYE